MIEFYGVTLGHDQDHVVLRDVSCVFPTNRKFVVFAEGGEGKTVLLKGLAGLLAPSDGEIKRFSGLSFPLGYTRGFQDEMTIEENIRFAAAAYETDPDALVTYVRLFPGLDSLLPTRYRGMPSAMQVRLSYAIAYGLPFDCFLIDGSMAVGDHEFRAACMRAFKERCRGGYIMTTRHLGQVEAHADCGAILREGELEIFDEVEPLIRKARIGATKLPRAI